MLKVLVCWEDSCCRALNRALRRALRRHDTICSAAIYPIPVRGNGSFKPFIKHDWDKVATVGLPKSDGPIEHLICIADADDAKHCLEQSIDAPGAETQNWVDTANNLWTQELRAEARQARDRVHGRFLRWNRESLLIAAFDQPDTLGRLGTYDRAKLASFLDACDPNPAQLPQASFVDTFTRPGRCLQEMQRAAYPHLLKKNDLRCEDAIDMFSKVAIDALCERVPDLKAVARLILTLGGAPTPLAP